ncbi:CLUMA_CG003316, isoform A [Clunio marinus]|uniref:CLUMA_CG003316, isoform A n=1 Tax=Clunio marinus TaxID=568069 RepID=A0A1J1HNB2_9DIPT|nr:CLUMA_CG003316, isoform A [Clunio marinus]
MNMAGCISNSVSAIEGISGSNKTEHESRAFVKRSTFNQNVLEMMWARAQYQEKHFSMPIKSNFSHGKDKASKQ